jgi:cytochrome c oxidase cbb3-type subunit 3
MKARNHKRLLMMLPLILAAGVVFAQDPAAAPVSASTGEFNNIMTAGIGIVAIVLLAAALLTIGRANRMLARRLLQLEAAQRGIELPEEVDEVEPEQEDFLTRMRKRYWEDPVPIEKEGDILLEHAHDGIRELDNRLPPWWVNMFIMTIIWAGGYMYYYHFGGSGPSSSEEYKTEMEIAKKQKAMALAGKAEAVNEENVTTLTEAAALAEGEATFKSVCAACHGQKGEGGVGPNMTDDNWIHGGGIKNVFKTIKYGVPEKGMISWQSQLKPSDMQKVASYILTLKGTNPPNAKAPQGEIWEDESAASPATTPATPGK